MNLSATIAIHGGGPGSGCHGPNCGRPRTDFDVATPQPSHKTPPSPEAARMIKAFESVAPRKLPYGIQAGVRRMAAAGLDPRLAELEKVQSITFSDPSFQQGLQGGDSVIGRYHPEDGGSINMAWADADTFIHEFGHHLDHKWLMGNNPYTDADAMWGLKMKAMREIFTARNDAFRALGIKTPDFAGRPREYDAFVQKHMAELQKVKVHGDRPYALTNNREWIASNFEGYMRNERSRERLKKLVPSTYKLIDTLVHGGLFKE